MNTFASIAVVLAMAALAPVFDTSTAPAPAATAQAFTIDGAHSSIVFRVKHMDTAFFYGRFNKIGGSFTIDDADLAKSTIAVEIPAESIDSANEGRDKHLKGPDFFDVKEFPTITLKSKSIKKTGNAYEVVADLTLHGKTNAVTFTMEKTGSGEGRRGPTVGYEAVFTIKRSEFGMNYGIDKKALADEVKIMVGIEAGAAK